MGRLWTLSSSTGQGELTPGWISGQPQSLHNGLHGTSGQFPPLWVIIRLFLLFETPQKLVSASFIDTMATEKSDTANKTNIKRDKSRMQSIIQTSHKHVQPLQPSIHLSNVQHPNPMAFTLWQATVGLKLQLVLAPGSANTMSLKLQASRNYFPLELFEFGCFECLLL